MPPGQWIDHDGVEAVRFPWLEHAGIVAYYTGRAGGVSPSPWASLNLSFHVGDDPERVETNRARALAWTGLQLEQAVAAGLVHGSEVAHVDQAGVGAGRYGRAGFVDGVDALMTDRPGIALLVTAADCVPVYLADPARQVVAVVHAGWRGTLQGVAARTAALMGQKLGARPAALRAVIGPAIGPCCYVVGAEVVAAVRRRFGPQAADLLAGSEQPYLDLWQANRLDLIAAGLDPAAIEVVEMCTACDTGRFFSHRGEQGRTGRQGAIILLA